MERVIWKIFAWQGASEAALFFVTFNQLQECTWQMLELFRIKDLAERELINLKNN